MIFLLFSSLAQSGFSFFLLLWFFAFFFLQKSSWVFLFSRIYHTITLKQRICGICTSNVMCMCTRAIEWMRACYAMEKINVQCAITQKPSNTHSQRRKRQFQRKLAYIKRSKWRNKTWWGGQRFLRIHENENFYSTCQKRTHIQMHTILTHNCMNCVFFLFFRQNAMAGSFAIGYQLIGSINIWDVHQFAI